MIVNRRTALSALSRVAVLAAFALILVSPVPADAADLEAAKRAGQVGEKPNGLLGLVSGGAPADVRSLVNRVNAERKQAYAKIAKRTGASPAEVGKLAGRRLIGDTSPGEYVMTGSGQWIRK